MRLPVDYRLIQGYTEVLAVCPGRDSRILVHFSFQLTKSVYEMKLWIKESLGLRLDQWAIILSVDLNCRLHVGPKHFNSAYYLEPRCQMYF